ncbi:hypothetical protein SESBI_16329 [Sesbania bispinosa]|nr:hypothetical protein SESBI_16329 [Sesbania bispinosa]
MPSQQLLLSPPHPSQSNILIRRGTQPTLPHFLPRLATAQPQSINALAAAILTAKTSQFSTPITLSTNPSVTSTSAIGALEAKCLKKPQRNFKTLNLWT